ncbi:MAG: hypothetical protein AB3N23_08415 [Paracoccaceae bacterium]
MTLINRLFLIAMLLPIAIWAGCIGLVIFLSSVQGCTIHEGFPNPCTFLGMDWSQTAYGLGLFAAWGPLIFGPVVAAIGMAWLVYSGAARFLNRWR